jgi:lipoate-protein ligase A
MDRSSGSGSVYHQQNRMTFFVIEERSHEATLARDDPTGIEVSGFFGRG